jgi:hypothetical protein
VLLHPDADDCVSSVLFVNTVSLFKILCLTKLCSDFEFLADRFSFSWITVRPDFNTSLFSPVFQVNGSRGSSVSIVTRVRFPARVRKGCFPFGTPSRPSVGTTLLMKWVLRTFSQEVKQPGREADYSPPSSAEIRMRGALPLFPIRRYGLLLSEAQGQL